PGGSFDQSVTGTKQPAAFPGGSFDQSVTGTKKP
ncbi:unnamed protein product, partial [Allacma fusca]